MQKILTITADDFIKNGITAHKFSSATGLFWRGLGIDPFILPGALSPGYLPSEIGSGTVDQPINHFVGGAGQTAFVTCYANAGDIYRINITSDAVEQLRAVTSSQGQAMVLWRGELRYTRNSTLGRATNPDGDGPTFTDDYKQLSDSRADHPLHVFQGNLYGGDGDIIFLEEASGYTEAKLTLPSDYVVVDIDDDGYYLVIAMVKKGGSLLTSLDSKVVFWDTVSPNFNVEWTIPGGAITALTKTQRARVLRVFTGVAAFDFSFSGAPEALVPGSTSSHSSFHTNDLIPAIGGTGQFRAQDAWAANDKLWTYGKVSAISDRRFYSPIFLSGIKAFYADAFDRVFASSSDNKLYKIASGSYTPANLETARIELKQPMYIKAIKLFLVDAISSGSIQIQITNENFGSAVVDETFNSTNSGSTNRVLWRNIGPLAAQDLRIIVNLINGQSFRSMELWGDPINNANMGVT